MDSSKLFDAIENGDMGRLQKYLEEMDPQIGLQNLEDEKGYTPLASAINFGQLQVLHRLHQFMAGNNQTIQQGSSDDNLLHHAIKNAKTANGKEVLKFVLAQWGTQLSFIRDPDTNQSALHLAASRGLIEVFTFLKLANPQLLHDELLRSEDINEQTPLHLSSSNKHLNVVQALLEIEPTLALKKDSKGDTALHKAVEAGEKSIVQSILECCPDTIHESNKDARNAYQLAKHKISLQRKGTASHKTPYPNALLIESYLKEWILRNPGFDPSTVRNLLFSKQGHDFFLDLQTFDNSGDHYLSYLKAFNDVHFQCENWLKFVRLPEFHCNLEAPDELHKGPRDDARTIFDSLRKRKVECILEVTVPDCPNHPHTDESIIHCLNTFRVKRLDWRKPDLSVKTILKAAPDVEEICLYSSGNQDVLIHWASYEGLYRLQKLRSVEITLPKVKTSNMEDERKELEERLKRLVQHNHPVPLMYNPESGMIVQAPSACGCETPRFGNVCVKVEQPEGPKPLPLLDVPPPEEDTIFNKMKPFLRSVSSWATKKENVCAYIKAHPIGVAIIDNGVASNLFLEPIQGQSFIEDTITLLSHSHWHTVTDYHGTQMAALIDMMNPFRRLYIAKACQGPTHLGVPVEAAINAIDWAIKCVDADILSMSWTISAHTTPELREKLSDALLRIEGKRAVFAAAGETGVANAWPADFATTITIANHPIHDSGVVKDLERGRFSLPGDDIEVCVPNYLQASGHEKTSGSSAATALAAGLASLILICVRFAYYDAKEEPTGSGKFDPKRENRAAETAFRRFRRQDNMVQVFQQMCTKDRPGFVEPWRFFKDIEDKTLEEVKRQLKASFDAVLSTV